jgi:hypothetical protein
LQHAESNIGFSISLQHSLNVVGNETTVQVLIEAVYDSAKPAIATLNVDLHYALTGIETWLEALPSNQQQPVMLPSGLSVTLNSISMSTTRGILFERFRGTGLQHIVLPIIDPMAFQVAN